MSKKIVVIGSYIEALVMDTQRIPLKGETLKGTNFRQTWGGKGSNQAVQAARLGAQTSFVSMVGTDPFADNIFSLLEAEGVDSNYLFQTNEFPTACGFIICSADGHNVITIDISALNSLSEENIDRAMALVDNETIVLLQLEIPLQMALYAARKSKEKGALVILNPAPAANLMAHDLSFVDYLTPNETEARICTGLDVTDKSSETDIAKQLLRTGCKNIVVTLGESGSLLVNATMIFQAQPYCLEKAVDSTGAGDAFNAGLAVGLAESMFVEKAMQFANAVGALACTKPDTIPSYHTRAEVETFMLKY